MLDDIIQRFLTSDDAKNAAQELAGKGIPPAQARSAVEATTRGAASMIDGAGGMSSFGGGGGGLGDLLGGLGGVLGGRSGGGAGGGTATAGIADQVATFVAEKTGLSPAHARLAVDVVLPKLIAMVGGK